MTLRHTHATPDTPVERSLRLRDFRIWTSTLVLCALGSAAIGAIFGWFRPTYLVNALDGETVVNPDPLAQPEFDAFLMVVITSIVLTVMTAGHLWFWARIRPLMALRVVILGLFITLLVYSMTLWVAMWKHPLPSQEGLSPHDVVEVGIPFTLGISSYFVAGAIGGVLYIFLAGIFGDSPRVKRIIARTEQAAAAAVPVVETETPAVAVHDPAAVPTHTPAVPPVEVQQPPTDYPYQPRT